MTIIKNVIGRQIIDSRGYPTVEVDLLMENGEIGRASVPSGASTGTFEAFELRDGDQKHYNGKGVKNAIEYVNGEIRKALVGMDTNSQQTIDKILNELDGTKNKSRLGANTILATSIAAARSTSKCMRLPLFEYLQKTPSYALPVPLMNVINGGRHANNDLDVQEFMIVPLGAESMHDAIRMGCEVFYSLKNILENEGFSTAVGDEGGFAPKLKSSEAALNLMVNAVESSGYKAGKDICFALDCASTEYYLDEIYNLEGEDLKLSREEKVSYLSKLCNTYPIVSIEDGMAEDDWEGWTMLTKALGGVVQLVGDDLFVTNYERIKTGINKKCANSVLIKPNQIGTVSETLDAIYYSQQNELSCIVSHRSGDTEDTFISDLCVGTGCSQIKTGSLSRSERLAKYNQLIRIEEALGKRANFLGASAFKNFKY